MRKISVAQIAVFFTLLAVIITAALATTQVLVTRSWAGDFYSVFFIMVLVVLVYVWALIVYRLFLQVMPLQEGFLEPGSKAEFSAQVNILFYLMLFNSLIRTEVLPVPLKTLVYALLGTNVTVGAGAIIMSDVTVGDGAIISAGAVVTKGSRIGPNEHWAGVPAVRKS